MRQLKENWKDLFQLFRVSLHMPKLLLSAVGLFSSVVFVGLLAWICGADIGSAQESVEHLGHGLKTVYLLFVYPFAFTFYASAQLINEGAPYLIIIWSVLSILGLLGIWSYIGTAISRLAAVEITRDERIEGSEACAFAWDRLPSTMMSFILPLIGFACFGVVIAFVALFINVPYLNMFVMLLFPLALVGGFVMALIAAGTAGGFPLFVPSIAVEGTDSFDAISRGFSYVLSRVWHYLWYVLVSLVYGLVCAAFVLGFAHLILLLTNGAGVISTEYISFPFRDAIALMLGDHPLHVQITGFVYYCWIFLFQFMALGFLVSYYFSSSTLVYLLMRKRVDGIDLEEVYEELDEDEDLLFDEESFDEEFEETDEEEEEEMETESEQEEEASEAEEDEEEEEEEEEEEQEAHECPEPDCDRSFDTEFGRDQHHRMMHQDDKDE